MWPSFRNQPLLFKNVCFSHSPFSPFSPMTTESRYQLEKGSKKHPCPRCGKKRFVRYLDTSTGHYLPQEYGRCDREVNCTYHLNPYKDGYSRSVWEQERGQNACTQNPAPTRLPAPVPASAIPLELFKKSRAGYSQNNFALYLTRLFGPGLTGQLISRYHVGTSKHWPGATVFWQINKAGKVRTGKVMLYNPETGRRVKEPFNHITWAHKALKLEGFNLRQCFFGEHLLRQAGPVAVVESEKTAIIASAYLPRLLWLAVGSLSNLSAERCQALQGRTVYLFPDLNGFEKWSSKAEELASQLPGTRFQASDLLERHATEAERARGLDLADYLTRFDWRAFTQPATAGSRPQPKAIEASPEVAACTRKLPKTVGDSALGIVEAKPFPVVESQVKPSPESEKGEKSEALKQSFFPHPQPKRQEMNRSAPSQWDITNLEQFFVAATLPAHPVQLGPGVTISDVPYFLHSHFAIIKANIGSQGIELYFNRLNLLKKIMTSNFSKNES
jgi:hypothetical protein